MPRPWQVRRRAAAHLGMSQNVGIRRMPTRQPPVRSPSLARGEFALPSDAKPRVHPIEVCACIGWTQKARFLAKESRLLATAKVYLNHLGKKCFTFSSLDKSNIPDILAKV